jgi:hypothetical protein
MMPRRLSRIAGSCAAALLALGVGLTAAPVQAAAAAASVHSFLHAIFSTNDDDLRRVDAGEVLSRTLPPTDRREVATLGVVRIPITPEFYVARLHDIAAFKQDEAVLAIGTFSDPPSLRDVAGLTLDDADVRELRGCRVGRCGMQLPSAVIERMQHDIDWRASDAAQKANGLMRQFLVDYVSAYRRQGARAVMEYADREQHSDVNSEFAALAQAAAPNLKPFEALRDHLLTYPAPSAAVTADLIYWSKEKVASRGVISVTHLAIARPPGDSPADFAAATRQLYGSHYYEASLGLTVLVADRTSASPATYVAYLNRSRIDMFEGVFGGLTRSIVRSRARSTVAETLERLQKNLGQQFQTGR